MCSEYRAKHDTDHKRANQGTSYPQISPPRLLTLQREHLFDLLITLTNDRIQYRTLRLDESLHYFIGYQHTLPRQLKSSRLVNEQTLRDR